MALLLSTSITHLRLAMIDHLTEEAAKVLATNSTIIKLELLAGSFGTGAVKAFLTTNTIKYLHLALGYHEQATRDEACTGLASNTSITSLTFQGFISDSGWKSLLTNTTIKHFVDDLCCFGFIGNDGLTALAVHPTINHLALRDGTVKEGLELLAMNTTITKLELKALRTGRKDAFKSLMTNNTTITDLQIIRCGVTNEDVKQLVHYNTTVTSLSLPENNVGDEGIVVLSYSNFITSLNLAGNTFTEQAANYFFHNTLITCLNLPPICCEAYPKHTALETHVQENKMRQRAQRKVMQLMMTVMFGARLLM